MNKFSELKYVRPDYDKVKKDLKVVTKAIKKASSYEEFKKAYKEAESIFVNNMESETLCSIRHDVDMSDKFYDDEKKYISEKGESIQLSMVAMYKALLKSPFRKQFDEEFGNFLTKKIENSLKLVNIFTISDSVKENKLVDEYSKIAAKCKCDFRGEECNFYGLLKHMESTDRQERKEAFVAWAKLYEDASNSLDEVYDKLVKVRIRKAKKLGFKNFIDYIYLQRNRYDYNAKDAQAFRDSVRDIIVPVCAELYKKQQARLGIEKLHWYDEALVFPEGNALPIGDKDELVAKAKKMYSELSKETDEYFTFMTENELFDLVTKPNKRLGGYCTFLPVEKAPFIFSNFNGTSADVDVLTHEAGHAFQCYVASRYQKTLLSISSTSEINEIHSMSMEHFAYPWMESFFGDKVNKYLYSHLCSSLTTIPYLVSVDEFQHRVFENPKMTAQERRKVWHEIEQIYLPWRDYDGNEFLSGGGFWMQKQHIFMYPFYYIDYALAQVCAYQFFIRSRKDKNEAWNSYLELCKRGGSIGYFDLLKSANLNKPFDRTTVQEVTDEIVKVIKEFEEKL